MNSQKLSQIIFLMVALWMMAVNTFAYNRGMTMITPSSQWREALPAGNGTIGALVYGSVNQERVLFNHNELWYGGNIADN